MFKSNKNKIVVMSQLYAPAVYEALNGVFCVYKPAGSSVHQLIHAIRTNLTRELNHLPCRPPRERVIINEPRLASGQLSLGSGTVGTETSVQDGDISSIQSSIATVPDLSDHPLAVGPRYLYEDFRMNSVGKLGKHASGVLAMGIGRGQSLIRMLYTSRFMRVYHVKGQLGVATHNFSSVGRVIEQTTFKHVSQARIDRVTAAMQAGHQKYMFTAAGVNMQSQEAYEMACRGLLRPAARSDQSTAGPVLYGIRCIEFNRPNFTLEIHAINESTAYLMKLIHDIGLQVRSTAVCTGVRRLRYGQFTLDHALLTKHCDARSIIENIELCRPIIDEAKRAPQSNVIAHKKLDSDAAKLDRQEFQEEEDDWHCGHVTDSDDDYYDDGNSVNSSVR